MRPDILNPLFRPVTEPRRHRPEARRALAPSRRPAPRAASRRGRRPPLPPAGRHHRPAPPAGHRARRPRAPSSRSRCASTATRSRRRGNRRIPYRVFAHDDTGEIALTFFHAHGDCLEKTLPVGADALCQRPHGVVQRPAEHGPPGSRRRGSRLRHAAADRADLSDDRGALAEDARARHRRGGGSPGPAPARMARSGAQGESRTGRTSPPRSRTPIIRATPADLEPASPHLSRLAYDELLASQLALALIRAPSAAKHRSRPQGRRPHQEEDPRRPALHA